MKSLESRAGSFWNSPAHATQTGANRQSRPAHFSATLAHPDEDEGGKREGLHPMHLALVPSPKWGGVLRMQKIGDLEINQDLKFERRSWMVEWG